MTSQPAIDGSQPSLAIVMIAKDEGGAISDMAEQLARQTLFSSKKAARFDVHLVANGCTDETAALARQAFDVQFAPLGIRADVFETDIPGKARAWNIAVHEIVDGSADIGIFLDADIKLADEKVLEDLVDRLRSEPSVKVLSGLPVKDTALKARKSLSDRFSLLVSAQTPAPHSINGSLYAARMEELRRIWLPVPTPGEDGILSAMVHTHGFTQSPEFELVARMTRPTHYFADHGIAGFFRHERRMTVGTVINGWLCEYFWAGNHTEHVGQMVAKKNAEEPHWVNRLVSAHVNGKRWALPPRMLTWRLDNLKDVSLKRKLLRAPTSIAATILNILPCIQANRTLRRAGAAGYW